LLGLFTEYSDEDINGNINILMMDRKINDNNDDKNKGINENLSRLNNLINDVSTTTNNNTVVDVVAYNDNHYDNVLNAINNGYRLIDTSSEIHPAYKAAEVGRAVKDSGISREEIYIQTKNNIC
jgi:DNA-binding Lrp family transcriptional regulator